MRLFDAGGTAELPVAAEPAQRAPLTSAFVAPDGRRAGTLSQVSSGHNMTQWIFESRIYGHVLEAVYHINAAIDCATQQPATTRCEILFRALNKLWSAHFKSAGVADLSDSAALTGLLQSLSPDAREELLSAPCLSALVHLQPRILNHHTLRKLDYDPRKELSPSVAKEAADAHRKLLRDFGASPAGSPERENKVLKRLSELLYIVRSNIAHGEKTPYGPDLGKRQRDEEVARYVSPVIELIIDLILDRPGTRLACYGTLVPGGVNHHMLDSVPGDWSPCELRGRVEWAGEFPGYTWNSDGGRVKAHLLRSSALPMHWARLDEFEGDDYRRHIVPVEIESGLVFAYVYEIQKQRNDRRIDPMI